MISRPYSSTLARRALGCFIAGTGNDADDQADESAAAAARNRDIVVDTSALLVSSVLGEFDYARGQFRTPLAPTASRQDVTAGRRELDGRSAGSPRHEHHQLERDVKDDTIGQHAEPPGTGRDLGRDLLYRGLRAFPGISAFVRVSAQMGVTS